MKTYIIISFALLLVPCSSNGSTIMVHIAPYPNTQNFINSLKKPGTLAQHTLENITNHTSITGIFATYAGFLEASNNDGFITFPRKHTDTKINLLITSQMTPIVMFEQTIQHWKLLPEIATQCYYIEQIKDPETELVYWQIEEAPIPEDLVIPLETIVIITEPKYVYVPTGISLTNAGPNLVLPTIYIHQGIHTVENSLYILKLAHLFRPANTMHTKTETYHALQIHE